MKTTIKLFTGAAAFGLFLSASPVFAQSMPANNPKNHDSTLGSATTVMPKKEVEAAPAPMPAPAPVVEAYTPVTAPVDAPKPLEKSDFSGPYVGAEGSYDFAGGMDGFKGGPFIGYGWTPNVDWAAKPYLGIEAGFNWSGVNGNDQSEKKIGSISLRPGAVVGHNVLAYGIIGYNKADFKSNITNAHNWVNGGELGLGAEAAVPHVPLHVRAEYIYSIYDKSNLGGADIKPHDNDVKLGLLYRFK